MTTSPLLPSTLLAIAIAAALGPGLFNLMIAVGICSSASFVQISRAAVLTVRNNEYVEAARAIGSNSFHTVFSHILPNSLAPIIVQATLRVGASIISASSLSFLGIGLPIEVVSWGSMLSLSEKALLTDAWWIIVIPGVFLVATLLCITELANAMRRSTRERTL